MRGHSGYSRPEEAGEQAAETSCTCPAEAGTASCELRVEPGRVTCPRCGQPGKRVESITVKALLAVPLTHLHREEYRFCRTPNCSVVYFSIEGDEQYVARQVREAVYQKRPDDDDVFVCYCFRHTVGSIKRELADAGATGIIEAISTGIRLGQCACDIRNPQGSCCLGNVRALVLRLQGGGKTTQREGRA